MPALGAAAPVEPSVERWIDGDNLGSRMIQVPCLLRPLAEAFWCCAVFSFGPEEAVTNHGGALAGWLPWARSQIAVMRQYARSFSEFNSVVADSTDSRSLSLLARKVSMLSLCNTQRNRLKAEWPRTVRAM
jgi:hypothetical protein